MREKSFYRTGVLAIGIFFTVLSLAACGSAEGKSGADDAEKMTDEASADTQDNAELSEGHANAGETDGTPEQLSSGEASLDDASTDKRDPADTLGESGADSEIDFEALQAKNPDIFAWLYVPGTDIDYPVVQSPESDDYYKSHTADGKEGEKGALYTEMPNMMNLCDFNTIIHGQDGEQDLFADLHRFENPDFFTEQEKFYIYLQDNVLTYEIFAAYYDEGSDILRRYDYTTYKGCEEHLKQIYGLRDMTKNLREGWQDLTPAHFLVTLNGGIREDENRQYVVIGVLTDDAAGKIDRAILD